VVGQIQELVGIYSRIQDWWGTCEGFKNTAAIPKQKVFLNQPCTPEMLTPMGLS
jgi:hypothetical protein